MVRQALNVFLATAAGGLIFFAFRWLWRQSSVIGLIVTGGIVARALLGLILFWVSYLGLPVVRSLQMGDGWRTSPTRPGETKSTLQRFPVRARRFVFRLTEELVRCGRTTADRCSIVRPMVDS